MDDLVEVVNVPGDGADAGAHDGADDPGDVAVDHPVEELLVDELLVEEISIDGMCGVY